MKRICLIGFVCVLAACVFWGCGVKRREVREAQRIAGSEVVRISEVRSGVKLTERDSVVRVRAPVEESRNLTEDSSFVRTSLAWSVAVWKNGKLWHSIGNFPVISAPVRTVERERWQVIRDTLRVRDTVRVTEMINREVVKAPSFWDRWRGMLGIVMIVIIAGYCAWRKLKLK